MRVEDCYMRTYTGKRVNPLALRPEDIDIHDIAHALACYNRFGGHAREPYNIAQHSVCVMLITEILIKEQLAGTWEEDVIPQIALQALLHDASEAYLGDVTKWLKMTPVMEQYRVFEHQAQKAIYHVHGLPSEDLHEVNVADKFMVRYEASKLYDLYPILTEGYEAPSEMETRWFERLVFEPSYALWYPWDWEESKMRFLQEYVRLTLAIDGAARRTAGGPV